MANTGKSRRKYSGAISGSPFWSSNSSDFFSSSAGNRTGCGVDGEDDGADEAADVEAEEEAEDEADDADELTGTIHSPKEKSNTMQLKWH